MAVTNVYIDGFNMYYGCLKGSTFKWLDLRSLCRKLFPNDDVKRIRYFTAQISARPGESDAPVRQQTYLRALGTLPEVSVHLGHFLTNNTRMRLAHPPATGVQTVEVIKTEEKGSDVNLAAFMLLDAFRQDCETAALLTNDSDLKEPIRIARHELGLTVGVVNPHPPQRRSRALSADASFIKQLRRGALAASQFPDTLTDERGTFRRPVGW